MPSLSRNRLAQGIHLWHSKSQDYFTGGSPNFDQFPRNSIFRAISLYPELAIDNIDMDKTALPCA